MNWLEALQHKQMISRDKTEDGIAALLTENSIGQEVGIVAQHPSEHPIQARVPRRSTRRVLEELNVPLEGWQ
jgi:hypothetical protein